VKYLILPGNVKFTELNGITFAPIDGWLVDDGEHYVLKPVEWIESVFKSIREKKRLELTSSLTSTELSKTSELIVPELPSTEKIEFKQVSYEEILENLKKLKEVGVLTNTLAEKFYNKLVEEGPVSAENFIIERHRKNPNTGKRRWNPPQDVYKSEEEKYYELAFDTFMSIISLGLEANEVYNLLRSVGCNF